MSRTEAMIGRQRELSLALELLASGARLVTIAGPPGIGKTRLALELVAQRRPSREVFVCELDGCNDADEIVPTMARSLRTATARANVDPIALALSERGAALVVIDNAEQVARPLAERLTAWRQSCPDTQWLVTSQWRLGLGDEHVLELAPLAPEDAERLWTMRARLGRADYDIASEREAVEALLRALDGIPLAIELAAARRHVLTARAMHERLVDDLAVLRTNASDRVERHRTLERAIEMSYRLLEPAEQALLLTCSVFESDFTLEAIEAVAELDEGTSVLEVATALREKSLLSLRDPTLLGYPDVAARYALYTSVRVFASSRLPDRERVMSRHAEWTTTNAEALVERFDRHPIASREAALELPNLRAVVERALSGPSVDPVLGARALLCALRALRHAEAPVSALGPLAARFLNAHRARLPAELRAEVCTARGLLAALAGDPVTAEQAFADAIADASVRAAPRVLTELAAFRVWFGRRDEARQLLGRALSLARANGDAEVEALVHQTLGFDANEHGAPEESRAHYERALSLYRALGLEGRAAIALSAIARSELDAGRLERARELFEEVRELNERTGRARAAAHATYGLACVAHDEGALDRAFMLYDRAIACFMALGAARLEGFARALRGLALRERGDFDGAAEDLERALAKLRVFGEGGWIALYRTAYSVILSERGEAPSTWEPMVADDELIERVRLLHEQRVGLGTAEARALAESPEARELAALSFDARIAIRLLRAVTDEKRAVREIVVAPDARWVRTPSGSELDLSGRPLLQRLVRFLVVRHQERPGSPATVAEMISAGWPGERLRGRSGASRVYVAIGALRAMGLEGVILGGRSGYRFDPDVRVRIDT